MPYFSEQTLPHHLSTQANYARRNLVLALFALAGGSKSEADRLVAMQQTHIKAGLDELFQRAAKSPVLAARDAEIAVKPFPVKPEPETKNRKFSSNSL
jgi:hypothetical protein